MEKKYLIIEETRIEHAAKLLANTIDKRKNKKQNKILI
jgi:hypothetical protein